MKMIISGVESHRKTDAFVGKELAISSKLLFSGFSISIILKNRTFKRRYILLKGIDDIESAHEFQDPKMQINLPLISANPLVRRLLSSLYWEEDPMAQSTHVKMSLELVLPLSVLKLKGHRRASHV